MMRSIVQSESHNKFLPATTELDVLVVDRRALWTHALTVALAAAWSDANFRTADASTDDLRNDGTDAAVAVLLGGLGLGRNSALREDMERVASALPTTPILLLTDCVDAADVAAAIRAGAKGYLASDVALAVLVQSLRLLMIGGTAFPGIAPGRRAWRYRERPQHGACAEEAVNGGDEPGRAVHAKGARGAERVG
jgi:DNA-binding NarL/FixJ family response regulator